MKKIKILILSLATAAAAMAVDLNVTPGQLEELLGDAVKNQAELRIKGTIDARDLAALATLPSSVKTLDLSGAKISGVTLPSRKYFGRTLFSEGEIPGYTFFKSDVETLLLPSNVTLIGEGAFAGSAVRQLTVPEGVTALGDNAFYGCANLTSVSLPSSLETLGKGTFANCTALKEVNLGATRITAVPERAFSGSSNLAKVILPASLQSVGREAFAHTSISELSLSGVKEFEPYALSGMTSLKSLAINPSATIGDGLLMDNISLASLSGVPELVPDYFAANCTTLDTQSAANGASTLGKYSFANTSATKLILLAPLYSIDRGALAGMNSLSQIDVTDLYGNLPKVDEYSFEGIVPPDIVLLVDDQNADAWRNDPIWSQFIIKTTDPSGNSVIEVPNSGAITVSHHPGMLVVESPALIADVRVYTADGRVAYVGSPAEQRVEIATSSLPSGVVIVAASDEDGNAVSISFLLK